MHIETIGTARIRDKVTGTIYEIDADELEWDAIGGSERQMGPETEYMAEINHPALGDLLWYLWEYPVGAENYQDQRLNGHELIENFDISLVHDLDDNEPDEHEVERGSGPTIYYSNDDAIGVTVEGLRRMSPDDQVPYLTHWFFRFYEDPAQGTPYNSAEGGYLYIHGGPYDARDEISDEFDETVSGDTIERTIDIVQEDGTLDWAPHPNHPSRQDGGMDFDYDELNPVEEVEQHIDNAIRALEAGKQPDYGSAAELELRTRIAEAFDQLEAELPPPRPMHGGIGHNNPPLDERFTGDELKAMRSAVATVRTEIVQEKPNASLIANATGALLGIARGAARLGGIAAEEFAKAFGKSLGEAAGKAMVGVVKWGLLAFLINAILPVASWLDLILRLF